ncbi:transcriptional regulator [Thermococcus litoralis DSM 5473]|uniref:Transcriptional regulator n=1 Tax=Thermococcus litoralis (strain ATCC 51850 / DSM 5473 / JCM 8560 / NS-C) TaxID=523849 RepID=H3ZP27_THELN|nr:Lrp/AsnC family transcriptional regulator [Thermococcus litoralis]EHR78264.1 transcriptional regulator [Thermococcus litoralis DSM 5473]
MRVVVHEEKIDKFDLQIIKLLSKNARLNYRQLAEYLNTTRQRVSRRLERLEREGIIKKYTIIPDFDRLGYIYVILGITLTPGTSIDEQIEILKNDENVKVMERAIGAHNLVVHLLVPKDMKEIEKKITEITGRLKNVEKVDVTFITEVVKFELV